MILSQLKDMPLSIPPASCEAITYTVLTAPACSPEVRALEVRYSSGNNWQMEILECVPGLYS